MSAIYPRVFEHFNSVEVVADGLSVYDFLGGKINVRYKHGWQPQLAGKIFTPQLPAFNEWMADWIAVLTSAYFAENEYTVIELGAGYGQWMTAALQAFRQLNPGLRGTGVALEADDVHYQWLKDNIAANQLDAHATIIPIFGAAGSA